MQHDFSRLKNTINARYHKSIMVFIISVIVCCIVIIYMQIHRNQSQKQIAIIHQNIDSNVKQELIGKSKKYAKLIRKTKEIYKYYYQKYNGRNYYHNKVILLYNLNAIVQKHNFKQQADVYYFDLHDIDSNFNSVEQILHTTIVSLNCFANNIDESVKIIREIENILPTFAQISSVNVVPIFNIHNDKKFEIYIKVLIKQIILDKY